jgi:hypothetical protein
MLPQGHLNQRVGKVRLAGHSFFQPYFVQALTANASAEVSM